MKRDKSKPDAFSRRNFLAAGISAPALAGGSTAFSQTSSRTDTAKLPSTVLGGDLRALVTRGDLTYTQPVTRSEEGMPVGNGCMGSLVWTTPSGMHFQINRCDVFAMDSNTHSFPIKDQDYSPAWRLSRHNNAFSILQDLCLIQEDKHGYISLTAEGRKILKRVLG